MHTCKVIVGSIGGRSSAMVWPSFWAAVDYHKHYRELERSHVSPIVNYPTTALHYSQNCPSMSTWAPGAERIDPTLATFLFHPSHEKASVMVSPVLAIPATSTATGEHNALRLTASPGGERITSSPHPHSLVSNNSLAKQCHRKPFN